MGKHIHAGSPYASYVICWPHCGELLFLCEHPESQIWRRLHPHENIRGPDHVKAAAKRAIYLNAVPPESSLSKDSKLLFLSSSKSFHLEDKSNSPFDDVHCIETFLPTKAAHKNYQELETTQVIHICKYNHICIFGCFGHVLEVKKMFYGCIGKVSFRITS